MNELLANKRDINVKAKKVRKIGKLPGILYGGKRGNVAFQINLNEFQKYIARKGEHGNLIINIEGEKINTKIISVQRDLATNQIINVDLKELPEEAA
ncbi:hypothetical protein OW763_01910 [Clostridium aestuarii]|uniref:Large ribosomal subunit protein bL25 L25 domain-containing protein n=1 Tax=Clostridium aestuarii TaxID=338193 RepID=A0ABT4CVT6_9CLOT|nr:hypothetical protein [Clostridium aestuarii]MCY6483109.1 hypothetical protein [Clostridium aestuarii]